MEIRENPLSTVLPNEKASVGGPSELEILENTTNRRSNKTSQLAASKLQQPPVVFHSCKLLGACVATRTGSGNTRKTDWNAAGKENKGRPGTTRNELLHCLCEPTAIIPASRPRSGPPLPVPEDAAIFALPAVLLTIDSRKLSVSEAVVSTKWGADCRTLLRSGWICDEDVE